MVRKRKRQGKARAGGSTSQRGLSLDELETQGNNLLQAGKYKEAVATFKSLLQRERRPEWVGSLAVAYAARARGLADRGMLKEATVIWRNRAQACDCFLAEPAYIDLLFQTGQFDSAHQLIQQQCRQIEERGYLPGLRMLCAAQALAGQETLLALFPEDDPLRRDFPAALAALQAYCEDRDGDMELQLKAIPFRSPFRDFRQILKALSLLDRDVSGAVGLLERVDAGSPFYPLSISIRTSQSPDPEFMLSYQDMRAAERRFATVLKGWSAQQLKLAHELRQLEGRFDADKLLRFVLRNKESLGVEYAREIAMRILVSHPRGKAAYTKSLGRLPQFHQNRITALRVEKDGAPHEIFNAWNDVCLTEDKSVVRQNMEDALIQALTMRHMARQWLVSEPPNPTALDALEHALVFDPDDRHSYLELIRLYRGEQRLKDARRLLDEALSRYPDDIEVLTEAVQTAIAGNAFKKATRFARSALKLDPINPRVREILLSSHLAHARKQIHQKKMPLARKELEEAANWARTEQAHGRIDLVRAILDLTERDAETARKYFLSGFKRTGGGLVGRFQLLVEAGQMGLHMDSVLKQARLPKLPRIVDREQVLALLHVLGEWEDEEILIEAIEFLEMPLKRAAKLDFSLPEMERLCETWSRLEQYDLRTHYAGTALKRWPDTPVFVFHQMGGSQDRFDPLSPQELERLESAHKRAQEEGDMRTMHRIAELLDDAGPFMAPGDGRFDPFGFDDGPESLSDEVILEKMVDGIMGSKGPPELEEMKRELSSEDARQVLREMLLGNFDPERLDGTLGGSPQPKPRKSSRKKTEKFDPNQFDLF